VILLPNTGTNPGAMMIVLSHTATTLIAMFGSILPSAITKLAIVVLRSAVVQELVLID